MRKEKYDYMRALLHLLSIFIIAYFQVILIDILYYKNTLYLLDHFFEEDMS